MSFFTFVKNWASITAAVDDRHVDVDFSAASIFPPRNTEGYNGAAVRNRSNAVVSKKFGFDVVKIEALRLKYEESMGMTRRRRRPSKVEALSAFLWELFLNSTAAKNREERGEMYMVVYIVDLRSRFNPPLGQNCFGNYFRAASAMAMPALADGEESRAAREVIEEIERIDNSYMRKFQDGYKEHLDFMRRRRIERAASGELVTLTFSSVCRFPIYEADFGRGKPVWVSMALMKISNQIMFMDTKTGDGVESYFNLKEEDIAIFERDAEFLKLLSSDGNAQRNSLARL